MSLSLTLTSSPAQLALSQFGGGRGPRVTLSTAGGFRLSIVSSQARWTLRYPPFLLLEFLSDELSCVLVPSTPSQLRRGLFSSCGCNYPPLRPPLGSRLQQRPRPLVVWGARGRRSGGGGHICLLCIWRSPRVYVSKQLAELGGRPQPPRALCRPDHKQRLPSLGEAESISNLSCFASKIVRLSACEY